MQGFVFRLVPPRPTFAFDMDDDEGAVMGEHTAYCLAQRSGGAWSPTAR